MRSGCWPAGTGNIEREAKWAADFTTTGYLSWYYGYVMTFLGEYVIATGDTSVMPGLKRLALETARGQSGVGTWGHRFAEPGGNIGGYGCINQPGLSLTIGMVLAREAGVKEPALDRAIAKAAGFLRWYVDKGAVPTVTICPSPRTRTTASAPLPPCRSTCSATARRRSFFAKMSTAAYSEREHGHTGNYFKYVWALLGVARRGPLAIGAYLREQAWYYDLARGWDTSFVYQPSPEGQEEHHKYTGWDCTGTHLIAFCAAAEKPAPHWQKALHRRAAQRRASRRGHRRRARLCVQRRREPLRKRTTEQLFAGLASWSPFVRKRSAAALGKREGDFLPALLKMLAGKNREACYGACEAIGALGPRADAAAPQLRAALKDADPWLQWLAAEAIPTLSLAGRKASVSDPLAVTVRVNPATHAATPHSPPASRFSPITPARARPAASSKTRSMAWTARNFIPQSSRS
jgi:hypothetical protein